MIKINKLLGTIDSILLSEFILFKGGNMSHLKLQKLVYYTQAYHLAYFDTEIIDDDFEAWVHGPVSRKIYNSVKDYSILNNEIRYVQGEGEAHPKEILSEKLTKEQIDLVIDVIKALSKKTGFELENMTHNETPWIKARSGYGQAEKCTVIIPKIEIKEYFREVLYGQESKN